MPELPEVETVSRELRARIVGRTLKTLNCSWPRTLASPDMSTAQRLIEGNSISTVQRRAKYILIGLNTGTTILVHLRMTGRFVFDHPGVDEPHVRLDLMFEDGKCLYFADTRKFARWYVVADGERVPLVSYARLGPEPLTDSFSSASLALTMRRRPIKSLLLDQEVVAGLGNIYADECLFRAGIHPSILGSNLSISQVQGLYVAIVGVLQAAIQACGTTFSDYRTTWGREGDFQNSLQVFRRTGEPCNICGNSILRIKVGGRSTHFCPACQPLT